MKQKRIPGLAALVLGVVCGAFFLLMSLDSVPKSFRLSEFAGLAFHMIPGLVILAGAIIGYKKPFAGIFIFLVFALFTVFFFHTYRRADYFALISLPVFLISGLFIYQFMIDLSLRSTYNQPDNQ